MFCTDAPTLSGVIDLVEEIGRAPPAAAEEAHLIITM
jgi:hypothetical protein